MKRMLITLLMLNFVPHYEHGAESNREIFPMPSVLEKNVAFWEDIFKEYSIHQVVIHDSIHMDVVYEVLDFSDNPNISNKKKQAEINKCKQKYRNILLKLHKYRAHPDKLSEEELAVYRMFEGVDEKNKFSTATGRLRAQNGIKERFREGYIRSRKYMPEFRRIFKEQGLPEDLVYLPHVESSFNVDAYSSCGAAGIWQFTRSTGKMYLKINNRVDERKDPYLSTVAAAKHLGNNYKALGEWPLAITAYNHGLGGMKRAKTKLNSSDIGKIVSEYQSKSFGFASRNFYAEFLAARNVARDYEALESPTRFAAGLNHLASTLRSASRPEEE